MSRRRREQEDKPDLGFEIPEFDEDEFIRKETISFRTTLVLFLYSIVTALVTFILWATVVDSWLFALLIAAGTGYLLRFIYPALKVDISHFGKKEWVGTGLLYFFSWLAFFIFLTNPPLYDGVAPDLDVHITPDAQTANNLVDITLVSADNLGVEDDSITFRITGPDGSVVADTSHLRAHTNGHHVWTWNGTFAEAGTYSVTTRITDTGNALFFKQARTTEQTATFTISDEPVIVRLSGPTGPNTARFSTSSESVEVRVPASIDVYRVWLDKTDGTSILLAPNGDQSNQDYHVYYASPGFEGFTEGNNTFTVRVQEHDSYFLAKKYDIPGPQAPVVLDTQYTVVIDDTTLLGDETAKSPRQRSTTEARTPGFDAPLVIIGVIVAAALVARQRRD